MHARSRLRSQLSLSLSLTPPFSLPSPPLTCSYQTPVKGHCRSQLGGHERQGERVEKGNEQQAGQHNAGRRDGEELLHAIAAAADPEEAHDEQAKEGVGAGLGANGGKKVLAQDDNAARIHPNHDGGRRRRRETEERRRRGKDEMEGGREGEIDTGWT